MAPPHVEGPGHVSPGPLAWRTEDRRFTLMSHWTVPRRVDAECDRAGGLETGGILVGRYAPDGSAARVLGLSGPPLDSRRGPTTFVRGCAGIDQWLARIWPRGIHYLGEWHLHPDSSAEASGTDFQTLSTIASTPTYRCPAPLLLIVGGTAAAREQRWWIWSAGRALALHPLPACTCERLL